MAFHLGTCIYLPHYDYARAGEIPLKTVRKMDMLTTHTSTNKWAYLEGEKVDRLESEGHRCTGTIHVPSLSLWQMPDVEWAGYMQRYCANVPGTGIVEVGNEVGGQTAAVYMGKLRIAADVLKSQGRGVLMSSPFPGGELKVWTEAAKQGAFEWCDGVCMHPYADTPALSLKKVQNARATLDQLGDGIRLHITEYGWSTLIVTPQKQAAYLRESFDNWIAHHKALNLHNVEWYMWNDWPPEPGIDVSRKHRCGVVREDGTPKPALAAMQEYAGSP